RTDRGPFAEVQSVDGGIKIIDRLSHVGEAFALRLVAPVELVGPGTGIGDVETHSSSRDPADIGGTPHDAVAGCAAVIGHTTAGALQLTVISIVAGQQIAIGSRRLDLLDVGEGIGP